MLLLDQRSGVAISPPHVLEKFEHNFFLDFI